MAEAYASFNKSRIALYTGTAQKALAEILEDGNFSVDGIAENAARVREIDDKAEIWGYMNYQGSLIRVRCFYSVSQGVMLVHVADESGSMKKAEVKDIAKVVAKAFLRAEKKIQQN